MATYVIGDVHGCRETLQRLLARAGAEPASDRLIFTGDLVNGGPESLAVTRWVKEIGAETVLGNHDLHLLAVHAGVRSARRGDTLSEFLEAPEADELINWLRTQPFIIRDSGFCVVHAGVHPHWSLDEAEAAAAGLTGMLSGENYGEVLRTFFANDPDAAQEVRKCVWEVDVFTRMRTLYFDGQLDLDFKGPADEAPESLTPWFDFPREKSWPVPVYFGHWAAQGLYRGNGITGLDSGCVWGGELSMIRVEDGQLFQEKSEFSFRPVKNDEGVLVFRGNI